MAKKILEVRQLTTKYITRQGEDVYSVDHVSLDIEEGKSLGIAGESGCGKSTLALSLMGYYFPPLHYTSGDIIIDGKNISGMDPDTVRKTVLGSEVAYIPQAAMNALNPTRKVGKFIEDVIHAHELPMDKKQIREMAEKRFALLGLRLFGRLCRLFVCLEVRHRLFEVVALHGEVLTCRSHFLG